MMARSTTCSNLRPDTLMRDRICRIEETSCNARPDHTFGSKGEELSVSNCLPVYPTKRTSEQRIGPGLRHLGHRTARDAEQGAKLDGGGSSFDKPKTPVGSKLAGA